MFRKKLEKFLAHIFLGAHTVTVATKHFWIVSEENISDSLGRVKNNSAKYLKIWAKMYKI